jgi:predicted acetyltransferase
MAEFFILRKYRRHGLGRQAAGQLFDMFPGLWTVRQQRTSPAACDFWRRAIPYEYSERLTTDEVVHEFVAT